MTSNSEQPCKGATCYDVTNQVLSIIPNANYTATTIPRFESALNVTVSFILVNLLELSNDGALSTINYVNLEWFDPSLTWNYSQYPVDYVYMKRSKVWTPVIYLLNSASEKLLLQYSLDNMYVYNGAVEAGIGGATVTACELDLLYFPFDEQTCLIKLTTFDYNTDDLVFLPSNDSINTDLFGASAHWTLTSSNMSVGNALLSGFGIPFQLSIVAISTTWKRSATSYIYSLLVPGAVLAILTFLTLFLPASSLEKSGVAAVLVLGTYVLQQVAIDLIPAMKQPPYCLIAIEGGLVLSAAVFASAVLSIVLHEATLPLPGLAQFVIAKVYNAVFFQRDDSRYIKEQLEQNSASETAAACQMLHLDPLAPRNKTQDSLQLDANAKSASDALLVLQDVRSLVERLVKLHETAADAQRVKRQKAELKALQSKAWRRLSALLNLLFAVLYVAAFLVVTVAVLFPNVNVWQ